jgi:hypothetical protein
MNDERWSDSDSLVIVWSDGGTASVATARCWPLQLSCLTALGGREAVLAMRVSACVRRLRASRQDIQGFAALLLPVRACPVRPPPPAAAYPIVLDLCHLPS